MSLFPNLERELSAAIKGEVKFDDGYRALYATDSSNYRQVPVGVVFPKDKQDIITTVALCNKYKAPVLCRGGGTSLAGQCCNVAVIMDFSKYYNRILEFNQDENTIHVETGIVLDDLRKFTEPYGVTFGPDPATHNHCTLGGMIGNNSCGVHSVAAALQGDGARTVDFIEEMEVLTYDGDVLHVGKTSVDEFKIITGKQDSKSKIYSGLKSLIDKYAQLVREKYPKIPRRVSGYNLDELLPEKQFNVARALAGTESTCVIILSAKLKLIKFYKERALVVLGYKDVFESAKHVTQILKFKPLGLEGVDDKLVEFMRKKNLHVDLLDLLPAGKGWLWVEFGGETKEEAEASALAMMHELKEETDGPSMKLFLSHEDQERIWKVRDSGLGATAFVPGLKDTWEGWEDSAVPPEKLSEYLIEFRKLLNKYKYDTTTYGHFGQGCVHCRINFDFTTSEGISQYKNFTNEAADLVLSFGGSLSGEHGDGQSRGELLVKMFGEDLINAFREFKTIWDPQWKMNPGKIIDAYSRDTNLRLGAGFTFKKVETHFQFPEDHGIMGRAAMRCVGVGECRKTDKGTMCPSYMVTLDEKHSTRGRAHLLFEMLTRDVLKGGWKNKEVKEALDLCLACKGCFNECPVNVDMATYKAEFFSHFYTGKIRPRSAYAFGLIHQWAKIASMIPGIVNFAGRSSLKHIIKFITGIAPQRDIPVFAEKTFSKLFSKREILHRPFPRVMLWTDTFNNYFFPNALLDAVLVLESGGFEVVIPQVDLCCGRPLYDFGMLDKAKQYLERVMDQLSYSVESQIPVVGLEPSCVSVFRNEMLNFFPKDEKAKRIAENFFTLAEFIELKKTKFHFNNLNRKFFYHGHCHHKAVMHTDKDIALLKSIGDDITIIDAGCCGLAGSFGFEKGEKYKISIEAGERILFPAVRNTNEDDLIISDGFSCREQILHGTKRKAFHLAEVLALSIEK
jgi:FAD/FMN-containing dehydrogenase/Fe-S oxidoreductase